ncbi:HAD family hydrolase [Aliiroseovarius sp. CAU 1755]
MTTHRSRPRAICIDLVRSLLTEHQALPENVRIARELNANLGFHISRRGAEIWQAAHDAGLPIVVLTELPKAQVRSAIDALPSDADLVIVSEATETRGGRSVLLESAARGFGMKANDILYIGDAEGCDIEAPASFGMRVCFGDDAVQQVQSLDNRRRGTLASGRHGDDAELAHTVLLPLDLNIYDMGDTELFRKRCHFVFDTVLIIEGLVATSGFGLKAIEKNVAGHAVIVFGAAGIGEASDVSEIVHERLHRIKYGGGEKLILVHTENPKAVDRLNIAGIAEDLGYDVELRTWKTLMSQFDQNPILDV